MTFLSNLMISNDGIIEIWLIIQRKILFNSTTEKKVTECFSIAYPLHGRMMIFSMPQVLFPLAMRKYPFSPHEVPKELRTFQNFVPLATP